MFIVNNNKEDNNLNYICRFILNLVGILYKEIGYLFVGEQKRSSTFITVKNDTEITKQFDILSNHITRITYININVSNGLKNDKHIIIVEFNVIF